MGVISPLGLRKMWLRTNKDFISKQPDELALWAELCFSFCENSSVSLSPRFSYTFKQVADVA